MSAVGKAAKGAVKGIGKVTDTILGGKQTPIQGKNFSPMSPEEQKRLGEIEAEINRMFGEQGTLADKNLAQSQEIQGLFQNNLKDFLTSGGQMTPEQQVEATKFIDQTFTAPAQQVVNQQVGDFESQQAARMAALGRSPTADIASQQAIAGEAMRQNIGLQAERGQRIQQASNDIYNRGLGALNVGQQGSSFLNSLGQQAFSNRVGLLNARSGLSDFYQKERSNTTAGVATSPGILGKISAGIDQASGINSSLNKLGGFGI